MGELDIAQDFGLVYFSALPFEGVIFLSDKYHIFTEGMNEKEDVSPIWFPQGDFPPTFCSPKKGFKFPVWTEVAN